MMIDGKRGAKIDFLMRFARFMMLIMMVFFGWDKIKKIFFEGLLCKVWNKMFDDRDGVHVVAFMGCLPIGRHTNATR